MLPVILPRKFPTKLADVVILPVALIWLWVVMFPTALTCPEAVIFDPTTLPIILFPVMLPELMAPPVIVPKALMAPPVRMFPVVILPVALICPAVLRFPALTLPVTDNAVRVPTLVMLACTLPVTLPAVLANCGVTAKLASS